MAAPYWAPVNLCKTFTRISKVWNSAQTQSLRRCLLYLSSIRSHFLVCLFFLLHDSKNDLLQSGYLISRAQDFFKIQYFLYSTKTKQKTTFPKIFQDSKSFFTRQKHKQNRRSPFQSDLTLNFKSNLIRLYSNSTLTGSLRCMRSDELED